MGTKEEKFFESAKRMVLYCRKQIAQWKTQVSETLTNDYILGTLPNFLLHKEELKIWEEILLWEDSKKPNVLNDISDTVQAKIMALNPQTASSPLEQLDLDSRRRACYYVLEHIKEAMVK